MSRDLFYAAEKRKRNYTEMMSMSSLNAIGIDNSV